MRDIRSLTMRLPLRGPRLRDNTLYHGTNIPAGRVYSATAFKLEFYFLDITAFFAAIDTSCSNWERITKSKPIIPKLYFLN